MKTREIERQLYELSEHADLQELDQLLQEITPPETLDKRTKKRILKQMQPKASGKRIFVYIAAACFTLFLLVFPHRNTVIAKLNEIFHFIPEVGIYNDSVPAWQMKPSKKPIHAKNGWDITLHKGYYRDGTLFLQLYFDYKTNDDFTKYTKKDFEKIPWIENVITENGKISDINLSFIDDMDYYIHTKIRTIVPLQCGTYTALKKQTDHQLRFYVKLSFEEFGKEAQDILSKEKAEGISLEITKSESKSNDSWHIYIPFKIADNIDYSSLSDIGTSKSYQGYSVTVKPKRKENRLSITYYPSSKKNSYTASVPIQPDISYKNYNPIFHEPESLLPSLKCGNKNYPLDFGYEDTANDNSVTLFKVTEKQKEDSYKLTIPSLLLKNEEEIKPLKIPLNLSSKPMDFHKKLYFKDGIAEFTRIRKEKIQVTSDYKTEAVILSMKLTGTKKEMPFYNLQFLQINDEDNDLIYYGIPALSAFHGKSSATELVFLTGNSTLPKDGSIKYLTINLSPIYKLNHPFILDVKEPGN